MTLRVAMLGLRAPWGTEGGVEAAVGHLAPRLAALDCAVTIYCRRRYNALGSGLHRGVRLVDVDTLYSKHLEAIVHTALAAPRATWGADVVHFHATGPSLLSWVPRLARRATVVTLHGLDWQREKWGLGARLVLQGGARAAATFPHRLIAVGQHLQQHYAETYGVTPAFIPNGVEPIPPQPLARADISSLQPGNYLLFVGRLVPEKGLERLLEAYGRARLSMPLVIVGGATHMEDYRQKLAALAPPGVILAGPRYAAARDALLTHACALVLPSHLEGFPLAALEAMAAGLPVLLSDIPPHRELLAGCPPAGEVVRDDAWPTALQRAARRPLAERQAMGAAGAAHVAQAYSWDTIARQTRAVYAEALRIQRGQL